MTSPDMPGTRCSIQADWLRNEVTRLGHTAALGWLCRLNTRRIEASGRPAMHRITNSANFDRTSGENAS